MTSSSWTGNTNKSASDGGGLTPVEAARHNIDICIMRRDFDGAFDTLVRYAGKLTVADQEGLLNRILAI